MMTGRAKFWLIMFTVALLTFGTLGTVAIGERWSAWQWEGKVMDITVPQPTDGSSVWSHVRVESKGFVRDIDRTTPRELVVFASPHWLEIYDENYPITHSGATLREVSVKPFPTFWQFVRGQETDRWTVHLARHHMSGRVQTWEYFCNNRGCRHIEMTSKEIVEIYQKALQMNGRLFRNLPKGDHQWRAI